MTSTVDTPATATSNLHDNDYKHSDYSSHCYVKLTTASTVAPPATATSNLHDDYRHSGYSSHCYVKLTRQRLQAQWLLQPLLRQIYTTKTTSTVATPATATVRQAYMTTTSTVTTPATAMSNLHDNDYKHSGFSSHCYVKLT